LTQTINSRIPLWVRSTWRWRIIYVRAAIDRVLANQGYNTKEARAALTPLCDELKAIYHVVDSTVGAIRPAPFPPPRNPNNLAFACPVSAGPGRSNSVEKLVDGIRAEQDDQNYWAHQGRGRPAWVLIDLRKIIDICEVHLQFRNVAGDYIFVPKTVGFEVSQDGTHFEAVPVASGEVPQPVTITHDVPKEGTQYSAKPWVYALGKRGRYVRAILGPSQCTAGQFAGVLELTEIEVFGR
jgi:hypothetical protein